MLLDASLSVATSRNAAVCVCRVARALLSTRIAGVGIVRAVRKRERAVSVLTGSLTLPVLCPL